MNKSTATFSKTSLKLTALLLLLIGALWLNSLIHIAVSFSLYWSFQASIPLSKKALQNSQLKNPLFIPNAVYRNLLLSFLGLYLLALHFLSADVAGFIAIGIGLMFIAKLKELHYWALLRNREILCYYHIQLICAAGYLYLGYQQILLTEPTLLSKGLISTYLLGVMALIHHSSLPDQNPK